MVLSIGVKKEVLPFAFAKPIVRIRRTLAVIMLSIIKGLERLFLIKSFYQKI